MRLSIKIEYSGSDDRVDLYVVRVSNGNGGFLTSLERLKHKYFSGKEYEDVWRCDSYVLCATKTYSIEEVIEALYNDKNLDGGEVWKYAYGG